MHSGYVFQPAAMLLKEKKKKKGHLTYVSSAVTYLGFVPADHLTLLRPPAPYPGLVPEQPKKLKIGNPFKKDGADVCTWCASTNKWKAFS